MTPSLKVSSSWWCRHGRAHVSWLLTASPQPGSRKDGVGAKLTFSMKCCPLKCAFPLHLTQSTGCPQTGPGVCLRVILSLASLSAKLTTMPSPCFLRPWVVGAGLQSLSCFTWVPEDRVVTFSTSYRNLRPLQAKFSLSSCAGRI